MEPLYRVADFLAGLDYAFPEAAKVGGFVSSATQTAKRALFCWSVDAPPSDHGIVKVVCIICCMSAPKTQCLASKSHIFRSWVHCT